MRLTKLEHSALLLEKDGAVLVIDPGVLTTELPEVDGLVGVVLTHQHPDHWTPDHLAHLVGEAHDAVVLGPQGVVDAAREAGHEVTAVSAGDEVAVGPFTLRFTGGTHAPLHSSIPAVDNVGVVVDGVLYHPGDSFALPAGAGDDAADADAGTGSGSGSGSGTDAGMGTGTGGIEVLAVPVGAPWLTIGDAMDFVEQIGAPRVLGIHDLSLSDFGRTVHVRNLRAATERAGGEYLDLAPGESLEL
ncbi:MBL fold metallo-hydrolase [Miniimonas sp. S16]|uniref:MBL fold metallo-hydrolase n=1 Tax=Miniimonas sp. S16 TaxID=2171623 RepID=UPI000D529BAC|nr:MBL fold metallo-hydrolase [Miniimonas sp. S16]